MRFSIVFISLFFLFSCSTKEVASKKIVEIDINATNLGVMPQLEINSVVALETNDNSLFGYIKSVNYFSENFYLLDVNTSKSVLAFSKEGKFINKTLLGRGPGEMTNPFAVSINHQNKEVFVWDQILRTMFVYDSYLNLISRKKSYDLTPFSDFSLLSDGSLLARSHYQMDYVYTLYSPDDTSIKKQFVEDFKYSGGVGIGNPISTRKRTLLIAPFDYNVYQLKGQDIQSEIYFDFGKYKVSKENILKDGLNSTFSEISKGKKVSGLHNILESENFILFYVYFSEESVYYAYNDKNEKVYCFNNYFKNGMLPKCSIKGIINKDTFYATVTPQDLIDFQKKTGKKLVKTEIDSDQNPFIITFNISEL